MSALESLLTGGPLIASCEAVRDRLAAVFPEEVFGAPEFIGPRMSTGEWEDLLRRCPLVAISWGGLSPKDGNGKQFHGGADWTVIVAIKNSGGAEPAHLGDPNGHGLLHMVQAAVSGLHGMSVPDVGHVMVKAVSNLAIEGLQAEDVSLAGIDITVACSLPPILERDDLRRTATLWSFPGEAPEGGITELQDPAA